MVFAKVGLRDSISPSIGLARMKERFTCIHATKMCPGTVDLAPSVRLRSCEHSLDPFPGTEDSRVTREGIAHAAEEFDNLNQIATTF